MIVRKSFPVSPEGPTRLVIGPDHLQGKQGYLTVRAARAEFWRSEKGEVFVVDCSSMTDIDSEGMARLVDIFQAYKRRRRLAQKINLILNPDGTVYETLRINNLLSAFNVMGKEAATS